MDTVLAPLTGSGVTFRCKECRAAWERAHQPRDPNTTRDVLGYAFYYSAVGWEWHQGIRLLALWDMSPDAPIRVRCKNRKHPDRTITAAQIVGRASRAVAGGYPAVIV